MIVPAAPFDSQSRPVLLVTRPVGQSARFAEQFRQRFGETWPVILSPLVRIEAVAPKGALPTAPVFVFTSEEGVRSWIRLSGNREALAWCVGPRTEEAARAAGFATRLGPGSASGLAEAMLRDGSAGPCLYVRGAQVSGDLAGDLRRAGIPVEELVAYEQIPEPLVAEARALLAGAGPVLVPVFSVLSAARLAAEALPAKARLLVAAMSPSVAEAARALGPAALSVAARPDADAMLDALGDLAAKSA